MDCNYKDGTISRVIFRRGFGFIRPDSGSKDIFFHNAGVVSPDSISKLREGNRVSYLVTQDPSERIYAIGVTVE